MRSARVAARQRRSFKKNDIRDGRNGVLASCLIKGRRSSARHAMVRGRDAEASPRKETSIMTTKIGNKGQVVVLAKQLIAGTGKHLANATQVALLGSSFTPAQIAAKLQQVVDLRDGVDAAKAATKAKIATEKADMPALRALMSALVSYVKAAFGA